MASTAVVGGADAIDRLNAPDTVRKALVVLVDGLARSAGTNLAALVLYGGLARGRYKPGLSDVNILVLLREVSGTSLAQIAPELRNAWRAIRADPLVLTRDEIAPVAASFPLKFLDIRAHHVVLFGTDPFAALEVPPERIRFRVRQELRNLELRLRRWYVSAFEDPVEMARAIGRSVVPLSVQLGGLLRLEDKAVPDDGPPAIFAAAAEALALDRSVLDEAIAVRSEGPAGRDLRALYDGLLRVVGQARAIAEGGRGA